MMLRLSNHYLWRKQQPSVDDTKVGQCFDDADVTALAGLIRQYYSSCLWQKGDIILVDNTQVMHAGMPGKGPRTIRAMIGNPLEMTYGRSQSGCITARARETESIGVHIKHDEVRS